MTRIAIIGAGLSGLTAAKMLSYYYDVTVFEQDASVGGRLKTHHIDDFRFDFGAQYFKAKHPDFRAFLRPLIQQGAIQSWNARFAEFRNGNCQHQRAWGDFHPHYVGTQSMDALCTFLAHSVPDIRLNTPITHIAQLTRDASAQQTAMWQLFSNETALGEFDWVICATPVNHLRSLAPSNISFYPKLAQYHMDACFTLMLGIDSAVDLPFDAAIVKDDIISWISANHSKPGAPEATAWVIQSTNAWANAHLDVPDNVIISQMRTALSSLLSRATDSHTDETITQAIASARVVKLHRWMCANSPKYPASAPLIDDAQQFAACGDWLTHSRVEAAFINSLDMANALLKRIPLRLNTETTTDAASQIDAW